MPAVATITADAIIYAGDPVTIAVLFFTNAAGAPTDPTTVSFVLEVVDEATRGVFALAPTTYTTIAFAAPVTALAKDSTGNYHATVDSTTLAGLWLWKWVGTGALPEDVTGMLICRRAAV